MMAKVHSYCSASTAALDLDDVSLCREAELLGIDVGEHRCDCERCFVSTELCPAARSSLAEAIGVKHANYAHSGCLLW